MKRGDGREQKLSRHRRAERALRVGLVVLLLGVMDAGRVRGQMTAELEAGYWAGIMCSAVFMAGRSPEDVIREELDGLAVPGDGSVASPVIDHNAHAVTVAYAGSETPRIAVFREGWGSVLLPPGSTLDDVKALPNAWVRGPMPARDASQLPWPSGDLVRPAPPPAEIDRTKLAAAIEGAFAERKDEPHKTLGVVVVYRGEIVAERYAPGWGPYTQYRSWSTAKSLTSALVGILVGQGKLDPAKPAPIAEWRDADDSRGAITLENLLHMSSGLNSPGNATSKAYFGGVDAAAAAAGRALEAEPGTRFKYSNFDTLLLVQSIKEVLGGGVNYWNFPRRGLFDQIGMNHTFAETEAHGNFILSSQVYTTPRDLARFGLLYLNDGVWQGKRILPEGWVDYTRRPIPAPMPDSGRRGYGAQFWLMGGDSRVPSDTYSTAGHRGQHATIVPSADVVVARMGLDPRQDSGWDQEQFVADILDAIGEEPIRFSEIYDDILRPAGCAAAFCHSEDRELGNMDLHTRDSAYGSLVGVTASGELCADSGMLRVSPGDPDASLLWAKLGGTPPCGGSMPAANGLLDQIQIDRIRRWISEGARND